MARTKNAPKPAAEAVEDASSFVLDDDIDLVEHPVPVVAVAPPVKKPPPAPEPEPEPVSSAPKVKRCCANCSGWRKSSMDPFIGQCLPSRIALPAPLMTTDLTSCQRFELRV